jgi:hypothetical protein
MASIKRFHQDDCNGQNCECPWRLDYRPIGTGGAPAFVFSHQRGGRKTSRENVGQSFARRIPRPHEGSRSQGWCRAVVQAQDRSPSLARCGPANTAGHTATGSRRWIAGRWAGSGMAKKPLRNQAWRGGRAVEGTGLENRRGREITVGSNPTPSATGGCRLIRTGRLSARNKRKTWNIRQPLV